MPVNKTCIIAGNPPYLHPTKLLPCKNRIKPHIALITSFRACVNYCRELRCTDIPRAHLKAMRSLRQPPFDRQSITHSHLQQSRLFCPPKFTIAQQLRVHRDDRDKQHERGEERRAAREALFLRRRNAAGVSCAALARSLALMYTYSRAALVFVIY